MICSCCSCSSCRVPFPYLDRMNMINKMKFTKYMVVHPISFRGLVRASRTEGTASRPDDIRFVPGPGRPDLQYVRLPDHSDYSTAFYS